MLFRSIRLPTRGLQIAAGVLYSSIWRPTQAIFTGPSGDQTPAGKTVKPNNAMCFVAQNVTDGVPFLSTHDSRVRLLAFLAYEDTPIGIETGLLEVSAQQSLI